MEDWLEPLSRRRRRCARPIAGRSRSGAFPRCELMETAGAGGRRGGGRAGGSAGAVRSSAARATTAATGWSRRGCSRETGFEVDALLLSPRRRALRGRRATSSASTARARGRRRRAARRRSRAPGWSSTRSSAPGSRAPRATRPARRSTRSTGRRPGGRHRHPLRGERLDRRGRGQGGRAPTSTVTFHAAKLGHWVAPGKDHTGELRVVADRDPGGAPGRAGGRADRRRACWSSRRAAAPGRRSSAPARWWSSAARAG